MVEILPYLINVSICCTAFYAFYYLALRKLTFFTANRAYLIASLAISLVIPLMNTSLFHLPKETAQVVIKNTVLSNYISDDFVFSSVPHHHVSFLQVLSIVYFIGGSFMIVRFSFYMVQIIRLIRLNKITQKGNIKLIENTKNHDSFSFFHYIFLGTMRIREASSSYQIIEHEKVHAREMHSIDLIFVELVCVLLWFNPFVFFYRYSIKMTHEYIADSKVIKSGIDKIDYLTTLANEVFKNQVIGLTSNFNYSLTKKRLVMITKINSPKIKWLRFILILPLIAILILAFSKPIQNESKLLNIIKPIKIQIQNTDTPSIMPIKETDVETVSGYGWRIHPKYKNKQFHIGCDFKAPEGTPIYATASGTIKSVLTKNAAEGKFIIISHNAKFETLYSHLSKFAVNKGDIVKQNQIIGYVGNTGFSTGYHLHYEVIKDGKHVNPKDYLPHKIIH